MHFSKKQLILLGIAVGTVLIAGLFVVGRFFDISTPFDFGGSGGKAVPAPPFVTIAELASKPEEYNGKLIRTQGLFLSAFETNVLGEEAEERNGIPYLKEPSIWISPQVVTTRKNCTTYETTPPITICTSDIEGIFEYGGTYGRGYTYQIRKDENAAETLQGNGILSGKVSIGPICPVESLETPCVISPETYTSREIVVSSSDRTRIVARAHLDEKGNYRFELPAGPYILDIAKNGIDSSKDLPRIVIVRPNQTTTQNISIDTGIR